MSTKADTVGARLAALHVKSQLRWDQLAKLLNISVSMLHLVKRGKRNLSLQVMHRLGKLEQQVKSGGEESITLAGLSVAMHGTNIFQKKDQKTGEADRTSHDSYIDMRLQVFLDLIESYDDKGLKTALEHFSKLAEKNGGFGKLYAEIANIVAHVSLRRQSRYAVGPGDKSK